MIGAHGIWRSNEDMLRVVLALLKDVGCVARIQAAPVSLLSPRGWANQAFTSGITRPRRRFSKKGDILRTAGFPGVLFFFGIWRLAARLSLRRTAKPPNWAQSLA